MSFAWWGGAAEAQRFATRSAASHPGCPGMVRELVHCVTLSGTYSERPSGQMQGAIAQEWRVPFQASATRQMVASPLARREPPTDALTALPLLPREPTLGGKRRLVRTPVGGSISAV